MPRSLAKAKACHVATAVVLNQGLTWTSFQHWTVKWQKRRGKNTMPLWESFLLALQVMSIWGPLGTDVPTATPGWWCFLSPSHRDTSCSLQLQAMWLIQDPSLHLSPQACWTLQHLNPVASSGSVIPLNKACPTWGKKRRLPVTHPWEAPHKKQKTYG